MAESFASKSWMGKLSSPVSSWETDFIELNFHQLKVSAELRSNYRLLYTCTLIFGRIANFTTFPMVSARTTFERGWIINKYSFKYRLTLYLTYKYKRLTSYNVIRIHSWKLELNFLLWHWLTPDQIGWNEQFIILTLISISQLLLLAAWIHGVRTSPVHMSINSYIS
jgi:hypothetical protein